jgi:hypothetical protein
MVVHTIQYYWTGSKRSFVSEEETAADGVQASAIKEG